MTKITTVVLLTMLACVLAAKEDHWAVLVAGSNGYWNYRHQADVCHAYQIVRKSGIPEDQIIVMAYDDIATHKENPFPGKIFNKKDGDDVYAGCKIDYKGDDVTPDNFLAVLRGEAKGKALKPSPKSKIFVYFSDHGAPGLIAFLKAELHASDLNRELREMRKKQEFDQMVIYVEACESGSMFDGILADNIGVFATTAANPTQPSYAYYCHPDDTVNGTTIGSCLGDEFSIRWLEDSDAVLSSQQTCSYSIGEQALKVSKETWDSEVQEFGDKTIKSQPIGEFQGVCESQTTVQAFLKGLSKLVEPIRTHAKVSSRFAKLDYLYNKFKRSQSSKDALELQKELTKRVEIEERFNNIKKKTNLAFSSHPEIKDHTCYKQTVDLYKSKCGFDEYDLEFLSHFVSLCNSKMPINEILNLVSSDC